MYSIPFTIILPVRNGGEYLALAVESVLAQTDEDWNLIILENKSGDGTPAYLASLTDPRITVVPADRALSIEENWGRIRELAVPGWVTILGHDDLLGPGFVAGAKGNIAQNPEASLWMSHFILIDAGGQMIRECRPMPPRDSAVSFVSSRMSGNRDSFGTGYVFRFEDYAAVGGIPPFPGLLYADDFLWFKLAGISYLYCSPEVNFSYRFHKQSAAGKSSPHMGLEAAREYIERLVAEGKRDAVLSEYLSQKGSMIVERIWQGYWRSIVKGWNSSSPKQPIHPLSVLGFEKFKFRINAFIPFLKKTWWKCKFRVRSFSKLYRKIS